MANSYGTRSEPLRFVEEGVQGVVREVFIPWLNALRFFVQNAVRLGPTGWDSALAPRRASNSSNLMDRWIQAESKDLVLFVREEMVRPLVFFVSLFCLESRIPLTPT